MEVIDYVIMFTIFVYLNLNLTIIYLSDPDPKRNHWWLRNDPRLHIIPQHSTSTQRRGLAH